MRFFILYLSLPLYFSQAGWLLWQPVALARFQTALMQEVITPDFQLTCRLDLARLTTDATVSQQTDGLNPTRPLPASDRSPLRRWIAPALHVSAACNARPLTPQLARTQVVKGTGVAVRVGQGG